MTSEQPERALIDLTDVEDDDMVPESLRNIVADMNNRLAHEHMNFLSVASVDPVVDDTLCSPEATPGLNPAAGIQQVPSSSDIFTPKPSLFASDQQDTTSALIDFSDTNFTSPPSYESAVVKKQPSNSLPPRPPSPPKVTRASQPEDPFASLGTNVGTTQSPTALPTNTMETNSLDHVSKSLSKDPSIVPMRPDAVEMEGPVSTPSPVEHAPPVELSKPEPQHQAETNIKTPKISSDVKEHDNLETLLTKDAVKYDLPPPTPASTVTGPQPLETPPRVPPISIPSDTPSPLSMSSRESPAKIKHITTPPPNPSPPPPRFSPSPIEKTSETKFTRESTNRLSSGGSSARQEALAKKIAAAKKSPDKPKGFAQRLFASVTRVAPAPSKIGELKAKPVSASPNGNIGELKVKPVPAEIGKTPVQIKSPTASLKKQTSPVAAAPLASKPIKETTESPKPKEMTEVSKPQSPDIPKVPKPMSPQPIEAIQKLLYDHDQGQRRNAPVTATSHFMLETAVSAAKPEAANEPVKHHVHHVKPLSSSSHLLQPTTSTAARNQKDHGTVEESFQEHIVSPEKVRPLEPTSHLLQSTSATEARKIQISQPAVPRSSPQRVKALPPTSHLLQATAATQAWKTERKRRPLPPAPPARRVVQGVSDRLMKPTTASQKKVEEGVARARERIRQRKLQNALPLNRIHSADSSRTSNSSKRSLTIPKSPKFTTRERQPPIQDENKQSLHNSLAECDSLFGKSLRSSDAPSVGTSSTSHRPKDLTIPISPKFITDARRGSKPKSSNTGAGDITLAHSTRVLQQSLRSTTIPPSTRKTNHGLTRGISPKFSTINRRALPKSTEERELEEMKKFQQTPFRAQPYPGFTDRPRTSMVGTTPSFMKPTQGQIARQAATTPKIGSSNGSTFKARPAPRSTFREPNTKPKKHSPTTETKPFSFQTSTRTGGLHTQMTEAARKRAEERALERQARNERKEADEVAAIRRKHAAELRREREKRNRLVAKLSPHNIPSENKKRTDPKPFQLASSSRHESAREEMLRKQAEEEALRRQQSSFRAKPVPKTTYKVRPLGTSPTDARPRHDNESERKVVPIETVFCD